MKNCWSILLLIAILQSLMLSILAGGHGHGSHLAHILAAGLIVQLLSKQSSGHHHHHGGRHAGRNAAHSEYLPYGHESWLEESRMTPESTLSNSAWAQRTPVDLAYSHSPYNEPILESYNMPYYDVPYPQSEQIHHGIW